MELNPTKREQGAECGLPAAMRTAKLAAKNICRVVEFLCRRTKGRATATVHRRASGSPRPRREVTRILFFLPAIKLLCQKREGLVMLKGT